jgi:hypothetical protein
MSNDQETLRNRVAAALRDNDFATWSEDETDDLVTNAVRSLWPRVAIPLSPASYAITLVEDTELYAVDADIRQVSRLDQYDPDLVPMGPLSGSVWEVWGDLLGGDADLHIARSIVNANIGGFVYPHGYGTYSVTAAPYIPDEYVAYVVAHAVEAAISWMSSDRARFRNWANSDQTLNTSVNELDGIRSRAQQTMERERSRIFTWRKPMSAR